MNPFVERTEKIHRKWRIWKVLLFYQLPLSIKWTITEKHKIDERVAKARPSSQSPSERFIPVLIVLHPSSWQIFRILIIKDAWNGWILNSVAISSAFFPQSFRWKISSNIIIEIMCVWIEWCTEILVSHGKKLVD